MLLSRSGSHALTQSLGGKLLGAWGLRLCLIMGWLVSSVALAAPDAQASANAAEVSSKAAPAQDGAAAGTKSEGAEADEAAAASASAAGDDASSAAEPVPAGDSAIASCISSFNETRSRVLGADTQSVILHSNSNGIAPYITLQSTDDKGSHYVLWQSLNGDIKGYALRNGKGFDYANNANTPLPLAWHPTLIWDHLFGSEKELKNYSCVLTGRTRVMGKRVSLLRLVPQEGLRYSFLLAKEDESDFPVELSLMDPKGGIVSRLTTMDSRIIVGVDFPISDVVFDRIEQSQQEGTLGHEHAYAAAATPFSAHTGSEQGARHGVLGAGAESQYADDSSEEEPSSLELMLPSPTVSAGATVAATNNSNKGKGAVKAQDLKPWPELNIPSVYSIIASGEFTQGGAQCLYQEYSDGITSFRVYRNQRSTNFYPVLSNGSISIVRKNSMSYEYAVVGEVPVTLAEFVLTKISN